MTLRVNFKRWIFLCIILPTSLLLIGLNVTVWRIIKKEYDAKFSGINNAIRSQINGILSVERVRFERVAEMPITDSLLNSVERAHARKSITSRRELMQTIEASWPNVGESDATVRAVLNNTVAETLRDLVNRDERITNMRLTDAAGGIVAATQKPPRYGQQEEPWWEFARSQPGGQVVSEGISEDGTMYLALAIWSLENEDILRGILCEDMHLTNVVEGVDRPQDDNPDYMVILLADDVWFAAGSQDLFDAQAEAFVSAFRGNNDPQTGWFDGLRFVAQPLDAGIEWLDPAWVITARLEPYLAPALYVPMTGMIVGSILALLGLVHLSDRAGHRIFINPMQDLIQAGNWALMKAFQRESKFHTISKDLTIAMKEQDGPPSRVVRDLDEWLSMFKQDLQDEMLAHTSEVHHDLDLARDFQMAYLNRPYPKVPEVQVEGRIRIEFYHAYKPALALGGDFFDILPLASDCAGVLVADVMGHGTRSALITAILRTLMGDLSSQGRNARHFITELNKQFEGMLRTVPNPLFASAFYFVADTTARVATFTSAGHPSPFHVRRSVGRIQRLFVPKPRGAALGIIPDETYTGGHCRLVPGDVFVFFTDGVYEAHNKKREEFGLHHMEDILRANMYKPAKEIVEAIMEGVNAFSGDEPLSDDVCVVAVEVATTGSDAI